MQKWEYLVVETEGVSKPVKVYRVNEELSREKPKLINYLPELGNQGWELVAVRDQSYFFKRPVE